MFENRIIETALERQDQASGQAPLPLRELSWAELSARLSATRELRSVLAASALPLIPGSFDSAAAHQIAGIYPIHPNDLPAINPNGLGNSKYPAGKRVSGAAHHSGAATGDRGNA